jgi:hypothetical protein
MTILLNVFKTVLVKLMGEKFILWLIMWGAGILVKKTTTKHDDELLRKIKELLDEQG